VARLSLIIYSLSDENKADEEDSAVERIKRNKKIRIQNVPSSCAGPSPADRAFLNDCGVFLHMLSWRDGYSWMAKARRESGEDKREFGGFLKREWVEFERRRKRSARCSSIRSGTEIS
jgi:hypothetical protein